jgi:hypothetical protein
MVSSQARNKFDVFAIDINMNYKRAGHTSEWATPPTLRNACTLINHGPLPPRPKKLS